MPPGTERSLGAWYAAAVGALALVPWLGPLLAERGWSDPAVAAWLAAVPALRMIVIPVWSAVADRFGAVRVLVGALVASTAATAALLAPSGAWAAGGLVLAWSAARAPAGPIVDAGAVDLLGPRYGRVRAVGSVSFLVVSAGCGLIRDVWGPGPVVVSAVLTVLTLVLTPPVARALPPRAPVPPSRSAWFGLWRHPVLVPLGLVSLLHGAAMSSYDNLFALHVERLDLPAWVTGAGIACGVAVEVAVLGFGASLLGRIGAPTLLALAVASSIPRFVITAAATQPAALIATQGLHGIGFGAFWLAATSLFAAHSPPGLRNSAQGLLVTAMFGAGPVGGLAIAAGVLPAAGTAGTFAVAAGLSALALVVLVVTQRPRTTWFSYRGSPPRPRG